MVFSFLQQQEEMTKSIKNFVEAIENGNESLCANTAYKKVTGRDLQLPTFILNGKEPNRITVNSYFESKWKTNLLGGSVTKLTEVLATEGMMDIVDYALTIKTGGESGVSEEVMTVVNELSSRILGEYGYKIVHSLNVTYHYEDSLDLVVNYTFYSQNEQGDNVYDGIL